MTQITWHSQISVASKRKLILPRNGFVIELIFAQLVKKIVTLIEPRNHYRVPSISTLDQSLLCSIWDSHSGAYVETSLLGCDSAQSGESRQTLRRNISSPSSGLKNKSSNKPAQSRVLLVCFLKFFLLSSWWFFAYLYLRPWRSRRYIPPRRWLTSTGLCGVI
jgi:hypothetical protein